MNIATVVDLSVHQLMSCKGCYFVEEPLKTREVYATAVKLGGPVGAHYIDIVQLF